MSSLDIAVVSAELDHVLRDSRINNIYQLNPKTLLLKLHSREGLGMNLILEAGKRLHTTSYIFKSPAKPSGFCLANRKYLRNSRIEEVKQHGFERIVEIMVSGRGNYSYLVAELFGEGNIILLDNGRKILQALSYRRMRDREIIRGKIFTYPPPRGKDPRSLQREDLNEIVSFGALEAVRAVARLLGISGVYSEELILRAGVSKNAVCSSLRDEDLDAVFSSLRKLLSGIAGKDLTPCVFVDENGVFVDVAPVMLTKYTHFKPLLFKTFNEALDEYYAKASAVEKVSGAKESMKLEVSRLERMLQDQEETLFKSKQKAEAFRKIGDVIYLHLGELQLLIERIMGDKRSGRSWKEIIEVLEREKSEAYVPAVYFQGLKPETLMLSVSVEDQVFDLDLKITAQRNAAEYFTEAKKAEKKIEGVERVIRQTREKIENTKVQFPRKLETTSELPRRKKSEWYEKFRWFYSSDGFLVIGGRDASTNEVLIKKHMESQDIVFHADISGAPFALIKAEGRTLSEQTFLEVAKFAASYSRAWKEDLSTLDVYWVFPKQVSKTPPSGEYLQKGSFMIYGTKNYVKSAILEVAIGVKKEDDGYHVMGGPPEAISKQTELYVRLIQGRESSGNLAKQIKTRLAQMTSEREGKEILRMPLEEFQNFIPSGKSAIK